MKLRPAVHLAREAKRLAREESGVALMLTLAVFLLLFVLCCGVYATGEIIRQRIELQNACDAAAYSASVVQADALSRMAVVNRAMSWTYIQMSREQMDYIAFSWLDLTSVRFWYDWNQKAKEGGLFNLRHYCFDEWNFGLAGLNDRKGLHRNAHYCGVTTPTARRDFHVSLNGRTGLDEAVPVKTIDKRLDAISGHNRAGWRQDMLEAIGELKDTIGDMNDTLWTINRAMRVSIPATVEFVLKENLPKDRLGAVASNFYWMTAGGTGGAPVAYGGTDSYFNALYNTEEDEIQFLQMADGLPSRQPLAPFWMDSRPVVLSDYFGDGLNPTEFGSGGLRYMAGGLDQWFVRGSEKEATKGDLVVRKTMFGNPPGEDMRDGPMPGIQRVYKHTNRDEAKTLGKYHRPNHVFQGGIGNANLGRLTKALRDFGDPGALLRRLFNEGADQKVYPKAYKWYRKHFPWKRKKWSRRHARSAANTAKGLLNMVSGVLSPLNSLLSQGVGGAIQKLLGGSPMLGDILKAVQNGDIPPSDEHSLARFPDQCRNVEESTGLVSQYEWASAYWICPWVFIVIPPIGYVDFEHVAIPVSEIVGCDEHGYGTMLSWLPEQFKVLLQDFGATREDYESCFINLDPTKDKNNNTLLRGYARIYGDDKKIFNVTGYVGAVAQPWVLDESFFSGDGTILVGVARKQENPFLRMLAKGKEEALSSIYEPFSPQAGADRYLVALSAARAVWAPRPDHPGTGMETMNNGRAPGQYEPRFDSVTDHKFKIADNEYASIRMGCVCGEKDTQGRLLRMWNLSQTDWDGALLPLRHAFAGHTHYDSHAHLTDGSEWEFEGTNKNAVVRLSGVLFSHLWNGLHDQGEWRTSSEVMAIPDATAVTPSFLDNLEALMPTPGRVTGMLIFRRLL